MPAFTKQALIASGLASSVFAGGVGKWSDIVRFPLVPVSGAVRPASGELLVWSSYANDRFEIGKQGVTQRAVWDPRNNQVGEYTVTETDHDVFCAGISMHFQGDIIVTEGDTAAKTSKWAQADMKWTPQPDMQLARGYQFSVTLSDGRIFTIRGS